MSPQPENVGGIPSGKRNISLLYCDREIIGNLLESYTMLVGGG